MNHYAVNRQPREIQADRVRATSFSDDDRERAQDLGGVDVSMSSSRERARVIGALGAPRWGPTSSTGSVETFEVFFRRVLPRAVAAAQRVTGEKASAEDAAVEALTKAHLRWSYLAGEEWRDLWVIRVSVNEAIRHLPRLIRRVPAPRDADLADMVATREMVGWALAALPRRQREVVVLRHF